MLDVAVVGVGPAGLVAARCAALRGAEVAVFERASQLVPSCCAGLVSPRTLPVLGVSERSVVRAIFAVHVHAPSGQSVELRARRPKGLVIDRLALQDELLQLAQEAGVEVHFSCDVVDAAPGHLIVQQEAATQTVEARVVIAADGPHSHVAQALGLPSPPVFVVAEQAELEVDTAPIDHVSVFFGQRTAPGFFGWSVPAQQGRIRVGLASTDRSMLTGCLDQLLAKHFSSAKELSRTHAEIPLGMPQRIVGDRVLLTGDAAGQTKPLSGGGLYTGGACARLAGFAAADAARSGSPQTLLERYQERCIGLIGREQAFGQSVRELFSRMGDAEIDTAMQTLGAQPLLDYLAEQADIDNFHQLANRLAREPQWWGQLIRLIPALLTQSPDSNTPT